MSTNVTLNGTVYAIPAVGDSSWGTVVSNFFISIGSNVLQKTGGSFTLTADTDFGATYGLKSNYFKSRATNPASAGSIRLGNTELIKWRNAANTSDLGLTVSAGDALQFDGVTLLTSVTPVLGAATGTSLALGGALDGSALLGITSTTKGVLDPRMTQAQRDAIGTPATGLRIFNTDSGKFNFYNGTAWFEIGNPMTTGGDVIYGGASGTVTRLANGSAGQVLTSNGTTLAPAWGTPSAAPDQSYEISNLSISATVAANALTIAIKNKSGSDASGGDPIKLGVRSATLATGTYSQQNITAALSMVVSSGSTLGTVSAVESRLWVYLIDNAGTWEVAVSQALYDGKSLVSTTAEGGAGGADSDTVIYSTTARTSRPIRLIGMLISTQTTAGTWAQSMTQINVGDYGNIAGSQLAPTIQTFTSGSGTYTKPARARYIKVKMVGGGGGGEGSYYTSGSPGSAATSGGQTSFAGATAPGGGAGARDNGGSISSAGSLGGFIGIALAGSGGASGTEATTTDHPGGQGGPGCFFGGSGTTFRLSSAGGAGASNTGGGGSGGSAISGLSEYTGGGGGGGSGTEVIISNPLPTYSYAVGAGGAFGGAGTNGWAGGAGGSGVIIVEEYY